MRAVIDGAMSLLVAAGILILCGVPLYCSYIAIRAGLVPVWIYAILGIFGFVAVVIAFDFFRKGFNGIAPLRERRR